MIYIDKAQVLINVYKFLRFITLLYVSTGNFALITYTIASQQYLGVQWISLAVYDHQSQWIEENSCSGRDLVRFLYFLDSTWNSKSSILTSTVYVCDLVILIKILSVYFILLVNSLDSYYQTSKFLLSFYYILVALCIRT